MGLRWPRVSATVGAVGTESRAAGLIAKSEAMQRRWRGAGEACIVAHGHKRWTRAEMAIGGETKFLSNDRAGESEGMFIQ